MSSRFLIGTGARNWSNTTIWSDTSNGTGGFSVPTSADDVIFDQYSGAGVLTLDVAASVGSLDSSALTSPITITSAVYVLSLYGNLTEHVDNSLYNFTGTSYLYILGDCTVTTNGRATHAWNRLYIDAVGCTVINGDDMNIGGTYIYHVNGTWNQAGKNTTTTGQYLTVVGTKTLTLGASTFKIGYWNNSAPTGFTFNYDTSTVNITAASTITVGGAITYYNLTLSGIYATNSGVTITGNITVNNNLLITGINATSYRALVVSSTIGTPRTITCNGTTNITNCDFRDITLAGTANRNFSTQTDIGDCGGNSGITFPAAVPQYFKKLAATANYGDVANWFSDVALTTAGRVPLPQDDATFLAGSFNQVCNLSVNVPRICRSLDMSAVNQAVTWTLANAIEVYGSYVLGNNITPIGGYNINLYGRGNYNLNTYSKVGLSGISQYAPNGVYMNLSNLILGTHLRIYNGTFDLNDFNLTGLSLSNSVGAILYLGNGTHTLSWTNVITDLAGTFYSEGSTIKTNVGTGTNDVRLGIGGKTYNKIWISGTNLGNIDFLGSNTIAELIIDAGRKVRFTAGTTQQIGKATIGAGATIGSITNAFHTLNLTGASIVNADGTEAISYSHVTPANKWFSGLESTDGGNNTGWIFGQAQSIPAQFTEAETLFTDINARTPFTVDFTESEVISSTLLGQASIPLALTECESLSSVLSAITSILVQFTESETTESILSAIVNFEAILTDIEIQDSILSVLICINVDFTELELSDITFIPIDLIELDRIKKLIERKVYMLNFKDNLKFYPNGHGYFKPKKWIQPFY